MDKKPNHLPFLDGMRGLGVLIVFFHHILYASYGASKLPWDGWFRSLDVAPSFLLLLPWTYGREVGVALFFVVSGFCIHLSYVRSKDGSWLHFFNRRFFRIYFPYLAAVLLFLFVWPDNWSWLLHAEGEAGRAFHVGTHLALVHNFSPETFYSINGSFWSIAVEAQLYAVYPLLFWCTYRFGWKPTMLAVAAIEVVIRSTTLLNLTVFATTNLEMQVPWALTESPLGYICSWSLGAYLAECYSQNRKSVFSKIRFDLAFFVASVMPLYLPTDDFAFLGYAIVTAIVLDRLINGKLKMPENGITGKIWKQLSALGVISYSFYLLHQPFLNSGIPKVESLLSIENPSPEIRVILCLVMFVPVLILSALSYYFVEKPSIYVGKMLWRAYQNRLPNQQTIPFNSTVAESISSTDRTEQEDIDKSRQSA